MSDNLHLTTQQMIADYYASDKKRTLAILGLATVGVAIVIISAFWLYQSRQKLEAQQQSLIVLQNQTKKNGIAVVNYLNCIGHIPKPVAQRTQSDYDVCLENMRKEVNGK
jgi:hypothetical protein